MLTTWAGLEYKRDNRLAQKCTTLVAGPDLVYVTYTAASGQKRRTVDMTKKICSCLGWQQNDRPCLHALAAAEATGKLAAANAKTWITSAYGKLYLKSTYHEALADAQVRLPNRDDLIPDNTKPSSRVAQAGRPKKKRIRSRGEDRETGLPARKNKCSNCRKVGHNYQHCPNPMV